VNLRCQDVSEYGDRRVRISCFLPATHELWFRSPWGTFGLSMCRRHALDALMRGHTHDPHAFLYGPVLSARGIPILTIGGQP